MQARKNQSMSAEYVAITKVISNYFDGLYNREGAGEKFLWLILQHVLPKGL